MPFNNEHCREKGERECPFCHEHLYVNPRSFANHVRHCKANPDYETILESTREALRKNAAAKRLAKFGEIRKYHVKCCKCGTDVIVHEEEKLFPKRERYFCKPCSHSRVRTEETKERIRASLYRTRLEKGMCVDGTLEERTCPECGKIFRTWKLNPETRACSVQCAARLKSRKINANKELFIRYRKCCQFKFSLKILEPGNGQELLQEFGMYRAANRGNNLKGVSRDHKLSIKDGFRQKVDPYYMSHPANCQLLQQQENEHKNFKSILSLQELILEVERWNREHGIYENKIDYKLIPEMEFGPKM